MRVSGVAIACALVAGACAAAPTSVAPSSASAGSPSPALATPTSATASPTPAVTRTPAPSGTRTPAPIPSFGQSDLVVRVDLHTDTPGGFTTVVVAADGTYVTSAADWVPDRATRRLTPDGTRLVRERVLATRLFAADASYGLKLKTGAEPPGHGASGVVVSFWDGARVVRVSTTLLIAGDERYYDMAPEGVVLAALAQALRAPETWLPATAWRDGVPRPYVAPYFRVVTGGGQAMAPAAPFDLATVAWPFATGLVRFGDVVVTAGPVPVAGPQLWIVDAPVRCAVLTRDDALLIRDALWAARAPIFTYANDGFAVQGTLDGTDVALVAQPMLPASTCGPDLF